ncbi:Protein hexim2 [Saguinus oedipus]|uniref:Protein hexim2 n=1 Tax=Saguinus oedipus TaxID=9490 RepID=A0ABQ9VNL4_SAGOE|nr:Protein hexim2 [Saguinus oedipus]
MMATPNQTACNAESPAALEEAKVGNIPIPLRPEIPVSRNHAAYKQQAQVLELSHCRLEADLPCPWRGPLCCHSYRRTSGAPGSPQTPPEPHDSGGSLPLTPQMESHSEDEDLAGAVGGLGWNSRSPWTQSSGGCSAEAVLARKKHRRRPSKRRRHWRPYLELSWAEKQQRDERQSQRASRVREQMFAKGQPVAPYNTTQFLMNDRDPEEPNLDVPPGVSHPGSSGESEAGDSDGRGRVHGEFQQRDFSEAYERFRTESLHGRSKQELVRDYLELEKRLSQAEEETRRLQQLQACTGQQSCRQVEELAAEVERLRTENQRLRQENQMWNREGCRCDEEQGT